MRKTEIGIKIEFIFRNEITLVTSLTPSGCKVFLACGSVSVRRMVVGPYRVRSKSKVRVSI